MAEPPQDPEPPARTPKPKAKKPAKKGRKKQKAVPEPPQSAPKAAVTPVPKGLTPAQAAGKKRLQCAPDPVRCNFVGPVSGGQEARCTRYTLKYAGGARGAYCRNHKKLETTVRDPREAIDEQTQRWMEVAKKLSRDQLVTLLPDLDQVVLRRAYKAIFDPKNPPKTQDEILAALIKAAERLDAGTFEPQEVTAMGKILNQISDHIEMFGGEEGSEGGARVLRLLPGMTLVEWQDPGQMPLRMEELKLIDLGERFDLEHGVMPPDSFEGCVVKYLGRPRAARTEYTEKQDPEGLRFYTMTGERRITYAEMEARAYKRWSRLAKEKPKSEKDDGEVLDVAG